MFDPFIKIIFAFYLKVKFNDIIFVFYEFFQSRLVCSGLMTSA